MLRLSLRTLRKRDLIPAIPQKCTPKPHREPQGKLCSLCPSVSKHPGFKKGISERKHPQLSLFLTCIFWLSPWKPSPDK